MKTLLALALLLLGALAEFVLVGRPALAAERQAHDDLLRRESAVKAMEARLPPTLAEELGAQVAERDRMLALAAQRLSLLAGDGVVPATSPETFEALLSARHDLLLGPDSRLGIAVRAQAGQSQEARDALTLLVRAVGECPGLEALELADAGALAPVPDVPQFRQMQASLVATASLTDVLGLLERLSPDAAGRLPFAGVISTSLRRLEPDRWGTGMHQLDTPPVRLAVTVAIHFARDAGAGP